MKPVIAPFGNELVSLRPLAEADLPATLQWRNRDEVRRWFKTSAPIDMAQHTAWFALYRQEADSHVFIVEHKGSAVGQVSIYNIGRTAEHAEIGRFIVAPGHGRRGYMKAAIALLQRFARQDLALSRLTLEVFEDNLHAIDLYRACGFEPRERGRGLLTMECRLPC